MIIDAHGKDAFLTELGMEQGVELIWRIGSAGGLNMARDGAAQGSGAAFAHMEQGGEGEFCDGEIKGEEGQYQKGADGDEDLEAEAGSQDGLRAIP